MPKRMVFLLLHSYKAFFKVFSWRLTERAYFFALWRVQKLRS